MFWNGVPECSVTEYHVMILRHRTLWDSIPEHPLPGAPFQNILYLGLRSRTRTVIKGHAVSNLLLPLLCRIVCPTWQLAERLLLLGALVLRRKDQLSVFSVEFYPNKVRKTYFPTRPCCRCDMTLSCGYVREGERERVTYFLFYVIYQKKFTI